MSPAVARLYPKAEEVAHRSDLKAAMSQGEETLEVSSLLQVGQSFLSQDNLFLDDSLTDIQAQCGSLIRPQYSCE